MTFVNTNEFVLLLTTCTSLREMVDFCFSVYYKILVPEKLLPRLKLLKLVFLIFMFLASSNLWLHFMKPDYSANKI